MIDGQTNIFEMIYPTFKIDKPIRLIELFAGYGSQALALKYLGVKFEHWKICEWAVKSIQAYKDIHFTNDYHPYGYLEEPKEDLVNYLYEMGISSNYNEPMTKQQIERLSQESLATICENIYVTNNLVNIQKVKGQDLEIKDTDKYCYITTYSFPCQDLSLAGLGKGMSDTSTRSGMLWEVERILTECKELGSLPQVLLMENVPQVHGADNTEDFNKWQLRLEELGYKNYWQDLIATDYGIPQTRNRTFMVSILGDYNYTFPKPIPLKLKLKDMLEENVDEKYFISDKLLNYYNKKIDEGWRKELHLNKDTASTLCNPSRNQINDTFIGVFDIKESDTFRPTIKDRIHLDYPYSKTICTRDDSIGVIIGSTQKNAGKNYDGICTTLTTAMGTGGGHIPMHNFTKDLRIRKLTPYECFTLMGVKREDFDKVKKNQSDSSLYHLAGDSIVVNVLMAIFKEMFQ